MKRVFVGMSGGVDSSAAAFLLKEAGYQVEGITFVAAVESGTNKCCSLEEIEAARKVCRFLGIPHHTVDLKDIFEARVIRYFLKSYEEGFVPNPCVMCNRYVKFEALLEEALVRGADAIATGHYARVLRLQDGVALFRGKDSVKDQSYFLSYVSREMLALAMFPLGEMTKAEVREVVEKSGMPLSAQKRESQDVCFVPGDYRDYLRIHGVVSRKGRFLYGGRIVGTHDGIAFYSLGQRRGLGVSVGKRVYIREIDKKEGNIILGGLPKSQELWLKDVNLLTAKLDKGRYHVQLRYQSEMFPADVEWDNEKLHVTLSHLAEIVTPGQIGVIYEGERVLGAGVIEKAVLEAGNEV